MSCRGAGRYLNDGGVNRASEVFQGYAVNGHVYCSQLSDEGSVGYRQKSFCLWAFLLKTH